MKLDVRDAFWLVITLVLLTLLGLEWRRASLIAKEIRELSSTERPLELVSANIENAAFYFSNRYRVRVELDWPSLRTAGIHHATRVTRTIHAETGQDALEQLFGDKVEVIDEPGETEIQNRPVYLIRAKR